MKRKLPEKREFLAMIPAPSVTEDPGVVVATVGGPAHDKDTYLYLWIGRVGKAGKTGVCLGILDQKKAVALARDILKRVGKK